MRKFLGHSFQSCIYGGEGTAEVNYYYWDPLRFGCSLKEGRDFDRIMVAFTRVANTVKTYPEYERLADSSGEIRADIFLGLNDSQQSWDPGHSHDIDAPSYRAVRKFLKHENFTGNRWSEAQIRRLVPGLIRSGDMPYVEEYTRTLAKAKLRVRLFFGSTSWNVGRAKAFHYLYVDALENASLILYGGHSGSGENLALRNLENGTGHRVRLPSNRYQIYLLASCSAYAYSTYSLEYFMRKSTTGDVSGTRNLEVLGSGRVSSFAAIPSGIKATLGAVLDWADGESSRSYQDILRKMDRSSLMNVLGDEDNPTSP